VKVHKLYWETLPNESDPDGMEEVLCGNESARKGSHVIDMVTCKRCLKRSKKPLIKVAQSIESGRHVWAQPKPSDPPQQ